jgi:hypothetical protein
MTTEQNGGGGSQSGSVPASTPELVLVALLVSPPSPPAPFVPPTPDATLQAAGSSPSARHTPYLQLSPPEHSLLQVMQCVLGAGKSWAHAVHSPSALKSAATNP